MATSTCVKCGGHSFEMVEQEPKNATYKFHFVQCTSCGGVVGVTDFYNVPQMLIRLGKKLGVDVTR